MCKDKISGLVPLRVQWPYCLDGWAAAVQCVTILTGICRQLQLLELMREGFYQMLEVSGWALWEGERWEDAPSQS